ncbi:MAG: hypothetical protein ACRD6X_01305 [Pyrinomonadaceae bacterium]
MDVKEPISGDIPTALPGFEDDEAREKLLLEASTENAQDENDEEEIDIENQTPEPSKRRWRVLRAFAGFALFLCLMIVGVSWFFGIGWFSAQKPLPVSRNGQKDTQAAPVTEDEKLKLALSMVAQKAPRSTEDPNGQPTSDKDVPPPGSSTLDTTDASKANVSQSKEMPSGGNQSYSLPSDKSGTMKESPSNTSELVSVRKESPITSPLNASVSGDAPGRSLFFGVTRKTAEPVKTLRVSEASAVKPLPSRIAPPTRIPFGTLLPIRLVGSIYTLRDSGGFVRMELTRAVDGKGYTYPAGTMLVGNVRGGESIRAFVTIIGLIDPASGELIRFSGERLGRDGGSGIEGKRRKLTSQWSRFFSGLKETAASVLGSVGALRSGGTVILSEPIRRGTESMTQDLSGVLLKNERNDRQDTFLEVSAGLNGYVLVTGLPENSSPARQNQSDSEATNK